MKKAERKEVWHGFYVKFFITYLKVLLFIEIITQGDVWISSAALHLGCRQSLGLRVPTFLHCLSCAISLCSFSWLPKDPETTFACAHS